MGYLEEIADYNVKLKLGFTPKRWDGKDADWLFECIQVAGAALETKGRLGDVDRKRKALDKKIARKVIWTLRGPAILTGVLDIHLKGRSANDEHKRLGAQVMWGQFCIEAAGWLEQRAALLAAYATRDPKHLTYRGWANKKCYGYLQAANELRRLASEW